MSKTYIGNDRCTRCGGGAAPCPVCNPGVEPRSPRKHVITDERICIEMARLHGLFEKEPLRRTARNGVLATKGHYLWYCDGYSEGAPIWVRVPDYPNDLNAVHRFEAWVLKFPEKARQWDKYGEFLEQTHPHYAIRAHGIEGHELSHFAHITARRRCECLIRALAS